MSHISKKHKKAVDVLGDKKYFSLRDALGKVKELAYAGFDETIDVAIKLGIDPSKGDQVVKGAVVLPNSRGKRSKVIVFAKGEYADNAKDAGADEVGDEGLIEKIKNGWLDFDYAVATPDLMGGVGVLAKVLGPRGLLPSKKMGTVTFEVKAIVEELKKGRAFFRNDKSGQVNFSIGKVSFDIEKLLQNLSAFFKAVSASRPASVKGRFFSKVTVASTMGVGISIDIEDVFKVVAT